MVSVSRFARGTLGVVVTSLVVACNGAPAAWLQSHGFNQVLAAPRETEWQPSSAGAYLVGQFALDQGDVTTAAGEFEQALKADPDNPELRRQLFVLKLANGEFDRQAARELLAIEPAADEARLLLALDAAKSGDYAAAERRIGEMGGRGIGGIVSPLLLAWALQGQGHGEAARAKLEGETRDDGFAALRSYHLAVLYALGGDAAKARELLQPLVNDDKPAPVRLVATLAAVMVQQGDRAAASQMVDRQTEIFDGNPVLERLQKQLAAGMTPELPVHDAVTGMGDVMLSLAAALQEQGIDSQAVVYARLASYMDPGAGDAWLVIARAFSGQGNQREAVKVLGQVPAASPYKWSAELAKAEALAHLDQTDDAVGELRRMAAERPDRTEPLVTLGDTLRSKERYAEAEKAYTEAINRLPELRAPQWRLLYARGICYERTDRWPQAEADLVKALDLQPDQPYVLNYLGYSWVDKGQHLDKAKQMLHRAVELRPEDGYIVDSLGWAYYRLGDYGQAVENLERAVELQPGDPTINDHLGDAYWRNGREREARFQWKRALSFKPEQEAVSEIEKKLANGLQALPRPNRG